MTETRLLSATKEHNIFLSPTGTQNQDIQNSTAGTLSFDFFFFLTDLVGVFVSKNSDH